MKSDYRRIQRKDGKGQTKDSLRLILFSGNKEQKTYKKYVIFLPFILVMI